MRSLRNDWRILLHHCFPRDQDSAEDWHFTCMGSGDRRKRLILLLSLKAPETHRFRGFSFQAAGPLRQWEVGGYLSQHRLRFFLLAGWTVSRLVLQDAMAGDDPNCRGPGILRRFFETAMERVRGNPSGPGRSQPELSIQPGEIITILGRDRNLTVGYFAGYAPDGQLKVERDGQFFQGDFVGRGVANRGYPFRTRSTRSLEPPILGEGPIPVSLGRPPESFLPQGASRDPLPATAPEFRVDSRPGALRTIIFQDIRGDITYGIIQGYDPQGVPYLEILAKFDSHGRRIHFRSLVHGQNGGLFYPSIDVASVRLNSVRGTEGRGGIAVDPNRERAVPRSLEYIVIWPELSRSGRLTQTNAAQVFQSPHSDSIPPDVRYDRPSGEREALVPEPPSINEGRGPARRPFSGLRREQSREQPQTISQSVTVAGVEIHPGQTVRIATGDAIFLGVNVDGSYSLLPLGQADPVSHLPQVVGRMTPRSTAVSPLVERLRGSEPVHPTEEEIVAFRRERGLVRFADLQISPEIRGRLGPLGMRRPSEVISVQNYAGDTLELQILGFSTSGDPYVNILRKTAQGGQVFGRRFAPQFLPYNSLRIDTVTPVRAGR